MCIRDRAAGTGNENLNVLKNIYQNLGTFIEKSEEQEEMEVEITKAELETIVAGAVQKAMGASQNAANPPQNAEGAAITDVYKRQNEKREQKAAVDTQSADNGESSPEKPNPQNEQPAEEQNAAETEPEITETRRFVVCPKCGEKIWL